MTTLEHTPAAEPFRSVTAEEIDHYHTFGWVKLEQFVPREHVDTLLAIARNRMGDDGDSNAPAQAFSYFNPEMTFGLTSPVFRPVIEHMGKNARALMRRRRPVGVRYFTDFFAPKLPANQSSSHGGNGISGYHQDYAASASDRSGGMVFWMALTDLAPESGTMSFVSGSHRFGVMGHQTTYGDGNVLDQYPELLDHCTVTEPLSYAAGDVTVHSNLCVHGAGPNLTKQPRWAYLVIVNPADACWNGGPADAFDTTGLSLYRELDDERFPVIG